MGWLLLTGSTAFSPSPLACRLRFRLRPAPRRPVASLLPCPPRSPCSVHASWATYFKGVEAGLPPGAAFTPPPALQTAFAAPAAAPAGAVSASAVKERLALAHLIRAYQVRGHEVAVLDPLALRNRPIASVHELDYRDYGFSEADLDRPFDMTGIDGLKGFLGAWRAGRRGRERGSWR